MKKNSTTDMMVSLSIADLASLIRPVHIVIHTNKTNNLTTCQGHLGGALDKKAETVLLCDKDADLGIINVSAPTCRHKDIPRFAFMYGANGFPIPADAGLIAYDDATRLYLYAQLDRTV